MDNYFRLIGMIYSDAKKEYHEDDVITFIISVKNPLYSNEECRLPIIMKGDASRKYIKLARKGNYVILEGCIVTKTNLNTNTGNVQIRPFFLARNMHIIKKYERTSPKESEYSDLNSIFRPDI